MKNTLFTYRNFHVKLADIIHIVCRFNSNVGRMLFPKVHGLRDLSEKPTCINKSDVL